MPGVWRNRRTENSEEEKVKTTHKITHADLSGRAGSCRTAFVMWVQIPLSAVFKKSSIHAESAWILDFLMIRTCYKMSKNNLK